MMNNLNGIKLSVIIPIYNAEKYLEECINSILRQTGVDIEVIAVEDGSTDSSLHILQKMKKQNENLKIISQPNSGVSAARNRGIEASKGDYVTFVDADDTIQQGAYQYIISHMVDENIDVSIYAFLRHFSGKTEVDLLPWENLSVFENDEIFDDLIPRMFGAEKGMKTISGSVCRTVFSKQVVSDLRFDESIRIQEDLLYCIYAYARAKRIQVVNEVKYNYFKHESTTTEHYRKNFFCESLLFEQAHLKALNDIGICKGLTAHIHAKRMDMYSLCISNLFRDDAPPNYKEELNEIFDGFYKDSIFGKAINKKFFSKRNRILYWLMRMKLIRVIAIIYKMKEKRRRSKAHN